MHSKCSLSTKDCVSPGGVVTAELELYLRRWSCNIWASWPELFDSCAVPNHAISLLSYLSHAVPQLSYITIEIFVLAKVSRLPSLHFRLGTPVAVELSVKLSVDGKTQKQ